MNAALGELLWRFELGHINKIAAHHFLTVFSSLTYCSPSPPHLSFFPALRFTRSGARLSALQRLSDVVGALLRWPSPSNALVVAYTFTSDLTIVRSGKCDVAYHCGYSGLSARVQGQRTTGTRRRRAPALPLEVAFGIGLLPLDVFWRGAFVRALLSSPSHIASLLLDSGSTRCRLQEKHRVSFSLSGCTIPEISELLTFQLSGSSSTTPLPSELNAPRYVACWHPQT